MDHNQDPDPIAELARLITQADPYGESEPAVHRFQEGTTSEGYNEPPALSPVPQLPADVRAPEQAYELDEYRDDDEAHDGDDQPCADDEEYQTEVPRLRRRRLALVMTGLVFLGTAGAFGYREMFGGSVLPTPPADHHNKQRTE